MTRWSKLHTDLGTKLPDRENNECKDPRREINDFGILEIQKDQCAGTRREEL